MRIWSRETGSAASSRVSLVISILRLNLTLTESHGIPPEFRDGVHLFTYNPFGTKNIGLGTAIFLLLDSPVLLALL